MVRNDLGMSKGKIASQAGHAFVGAVLRSSPEILAEYHKDLPSPGTKVVLSVPNLEALKLAEAQAIEAGIPHFLVIDSGCENFFGGKPMVTALGLGPATKEQIQHITGQFKLIH